MTFNDRHHLVQHLAQVVVFCALVAVLTTAIWPQNSYWVQWGRSLCIGLPTWAFIDLGRLLVDPRHCHRLSHDVNHDAHGWPKGWRGVLLVTTGVSLGYLLGESLGNWLFGQSTAPSAAEAQRDAQIGLMITVAAGVVASLYFYLRGKTHALESATRAAERDAAEAHLRLLQSQLAPHMLFNTLANLRALIGSDPQAAQQMLDQLNNYLRATLDASRSAQHPLATEFARLGDYLALMAVRMGPRLSTGLHLPPDLHHVPVPPLLLQPLVENAIQHGLEPRVQGGRIEVSAARRGDALVLIVADTGVGFDTTASASRFGLAQVHERIATAYGAQGHTQAQMHVQSRLGQGTQVVLTLPLTLPLTTGLQEVVGIGQTDRQTDSQGVHTSAHV
ncbi:sensor histidine kinase [Ottowia sp.]|uniref:sensor histidine kinase n=1 Tax=Ottowia sp. TaxID=1898956 RepID=UPI003A84AF0F